MFMLIPCFDAYDLPADGPERFAGQRAILGGLVEYGMGLARALRRRMIELQPGPVAGAAEAGRAFCRIARAVRRAVALGVHLLQAEQDWRAGRCTPEPDAAMIAKQRARPAADRDGDGPAAPRSAEARRERVERDTPDPDDGPRTASPGRPRPQRSRDRDPDRAFFKLPFADQVARICRDLGLPGDWSAIGPETRALAPVVEPAAEPVAVDPPPEPTPHREGSPSLNDREAPSEAEGPS